MRSDQINEHNMNYELFDHIAIISVHTVLIRDSLELTLIRLAMLLLFIS